MIGGIYNESNSDFSALLNQKIEAGAQGNIEALIVSGIFIIFGDQIGKITIIC